MAAYTANFNGFGLGTTDYSGNYHIEKIDVGAPKTNVSKFELAKADGQVITAQFYGERRIEVKGKINASSLDDMYTKLDSLKAALVGIEKPLLVYFDSQLRKYVATVDNFDYNIQGYLCTYTIAFSADALAVDTSTTSLTFGTYTASSTSYNNTIGGTYKSLLSLDYTLSQVEPYWTSKYLQFYSPTNNQRIRITRTWGWFDRITIDGPTKAVNVYPTTITVIDNADSITGWTSGNTLSLETASMKQGTGCFKTVMGAAAASSYVQRLNATAVDLSSTVGTVIIPIFIPTPTSGTVASVDLYMGSDATLGTNYVYYNKTTQWDGSAIASNAWNYFTFDLSTSATGSSGSATRTAIKSIQIKLNATATMQLNGWLCDYITVQKASIVAQAQDYEGTILELPTGSNSITVSDELTSRKITVTGSYIKRYL